MAAKFFAVKVKRNSRLRILVATPSTYAGDVVANIISGGFDRHGMNLGQVIYVHNVATEQNYVKAYGSTLCSKMLTEIPEEL